MFRPLRPIRPVRVVRPLGAPLVRGLVVGGAVYAAGRSAADAARDQQDQSRAIADLQARRARPAHRQPSVPGGADVTGDLAQLGEMVQQGLLTPEEFTAAKAKLLA